ncbi:MAG: hypothetical protein B7Y39_19390 [Bdellovibrio sp. 28-41-41]|nr:MAG: hypothetical protein B7Y39_19390 [Bdellovibrio sp. 28-41-41]
MKNTSVLISIAISTLATLAIAEPILNSYAGVDYQNKKCEISIVSEAYIGAPQGSVRTDVHLLLGDLGKYGYDTIFSAPSIQNSRGFVSPIENAYLIESGPNSYRAVVGAPISVGRMGIIKYSLTFTYGIGALINSYHVKIVDQSTGKKTERACFKLFKTK